MSVYHTTVLVNEAIDALQVQKSKLYIDATLGGGGHAQEILRNGGKLLALDADLHAIEFSRKKLQGLFPEFREGTDYFLEHTNFRSLASVTEYHNFFPVSGVLFDLGVSSYQLDTPSRGFSYRFIDQPFDLRLDDTKGTPGYIYLERSTRQQLYEDITTFSEEERTRAIVDAFCIARSVKKLYTTGDVLKVIEEIVGEKQVYAVASRIFQAIRIVINDEFGALKEALNSLNTVVETNGRVVIISFHSLEDRFVKLWMQNPNWKVISKKPIQPSEDEQRENKRSRSAKMRIAQKK